MEWLLAQLVSTFDIVTMVADWAVEHWGAALFFSGIIAALVDRLVKWLPTEIDDSLWSATKKAVVNEVNKRRKIK